MSWVKNTLTSSIGQKLVMGLTGLFLIIFLLIHLIGNISLLSADGEAFNKYAYFMKHNPVIKIGEVFMFLGFLLHIVQGIALMRKNGAARSQGYAVAHKHEKVKITSKYMGPFGIVILLFLGLHLYDFFSFKYFRDLHTNLDTTNITYLKDTASQVIYDGVEMENLHAKVHEVYVNSPIHWIVYLVSMIVVGLHLSHGFQSAFQTLGVNHPKYSPIIKGLGTVYSIIIPLAFALIPLLLKFDFHF
jgi:succinate dehydrogenase / fumarate reductase, cytochrome b subunit